MLLIDLGTETARLLSFDAMYPLKAQWLPDGCQLYVTLLTTVGEENIAVVRTDLKGNILQEVFRHSRSDPSREAHIGNWQVSPLEDKVAYMVYTGQFHYSNSDFQNIEVASLGSSEAPVALTSRDGALSFAWSPDGRRLAFNDFDDRRVRQVYVSNADGSGRIQVSRLTERGSADGDFKGNSIDTPVWSPDGTALAFASSYLDASQMSTGWVNIVSSRGDKIIQIMPENLPSASILGWTEDGARLAFAVYRKSHSGNSGEEAIYWVDTASGDVVQMLDSTEIPGSHFALAFPAASIDMVGILTGNPDGDSYLYDVQTGSLTTFAAPGLYEDNSFGLEVSPPGFRGEAACMGESDTQSP